MAMRIYPQATLTSNPCSNTNPEHIAACIEVAAVYGFPVAVCDDQNSSDSIARLKEWAPDLIIFSGGNILRQQMLATPRLGVLNVHLGLLPEIRGMSSPEWSLLQGVPVGITIHYMDAGIDTGPILRRYEIPNAAQSRSLADLRNRLIAFGVEKTGGVVEEMIRGTISAAPQSEFEKDNQFFVMHEWLQARAAARLSDRAAPAAVPCMGKLMEDRHPAASRPHFRHARRHAAPAI